MVTVLKIIFTLHAEKQLKERSIAKETVYKTVLNPDQVIPQDEGIFLFQSVYYENNKQYLLRVAVKLQSDRCLIITAYRTSKIQKYWGED